MTPPVFSNCPSEPISLDFLQPAYYQQPIATDNSGQLKSVETDNSFRPGDTLQTPEVITYTAVDYEGLTTSCRVTLEPRGTV